MVELAEEFLFALGATKPSPHTVAAYRRDLAGVVALVAEASGVGASELRLSELTKSALRRAFAGWASGHAKASVLRAWSAWNSFFRHLVGEDLLEGNPMDGVGKPKASRGPVKVIRGVGVAARLLEAAAVPDPRARSPWPERDLALVATFAVTGLRLAEALSLTVASIDGPPDERRLSIVGKGDRARTIPVHDGLERVIGRYLASRAERFPSHDLGHPATALFVSPAGERMTPRQVQYLVERLYVRAGSGPRCRRGRWCTPCGTRSPPQRSRAAPACSRCPSYSGTPRSTRRGAISRRRRTSSGMRPRPIPPRWRSVSSWAEPPGRWGPNPGVPTLAWRAAGDAKVSVLRAWSAWNSVFRHLVAADLLEGNPWTASASRRPPRAPSR
ncbi:MAG: site-specific integrase [Actinomycetota bacterium]